VGRLNQVHTVKDVISKLVEQYAESVERLEKLSS
jgi:hypothetical protein